MGPGKPSEGLARPLSQMSSGMSQLIGLKEKGLPHIARLLQSGNSDVVRSGASLLSNMSRHPALHRVMGERPCGRDPTLQSLLGSPPLTSPWGSILEGEAGPRAAWAWEGAGHLGGEQVRRFHRATSPEWEVPGWEPG